MPAKLCLNMIVKNEAVRIERCLKSVAPWISCWSITDTGSTDGTPKLIADFFYERGIPGEMVYTTFVNFEQARNVGLRNAREMLSSDRHRYPADYLLLCDADMELVVDDKKFRDHLTAPAYDVAQRAGTLLYSNRRLVRADQTGFYRGVTHEYLDIGGEGHLDGVHFVDHADGENRKDKFTRDVALLLEGLKKEPDNARYVFYLAQSYRDAGMHLDAAREYKRRVAMGGWDEEVHNAQMNYAFAVRNAGNEHAFVHEMLKAYEMRPRRAEPLYDLAKFYREKGMNYPSCCFAEEGMTIPQPDDVLFVQEYVYKTGLREEFAITAYYDPARRERGHFVCDRLALEGNEGAKQNLQWYIGPLSDILPSFKSKQIKFTAEEGWTALNPSVAVHRGNIYTTVRTVNYTITESGHYQIRGGDGSITDTNPINTRNFLLRLDFDLDTMYAGEIHREHEPEFKLVVGCEDMRLFSWKDQLRFSACVRDMNPEGYCEQAVGKITGGKWHFRAEDVACVFPTGQRHHEKNWAPMVDGDDLKWVYRLGEMIDTRGYKFPQVQAHPQYNTGAISGGSQAIEFFGGWLMIVHEARYKADGTRMYWHRFAYLKADKSIGWISRAFYLHAKQIEFVAGLAWHPDPRRNDLIISYGVADKEAWLATVDAQCVYNLMQEDSHAKC